MGGAEIPAGAQAVADWQARHPEWRVEEGRRISKSFRFPDFRQALDFVNRVGAAAEAQGHHPDLHLAWGRVDVTTWTHSTGGLTERDFVLAAAIDAAYLGG